MSKFEKLDPLLHSQLRLAIMSSLISVESAEFVYLQEVTEASSGNLSVQLDKLDKAGYLIITKSFRGKRPVTSCKITKKGVSAFEKYVDSLKRYIK